jgi:hypothetical protein
LEWSYLLGGSNILLCRIPGKPCPGNAGSREPWLSSKISNEQEKRALIASVICLEGGIWLTTEIRKKDYGEVECPRELWKKLCQQLTATGS